MAHIKKIYIDSFRGIKNLELDNLSRVNIITGDNNCGKTSVLEIIESFCQPDDIRLWNSLIRKDSRDSIRTGMTIYEGFSDLFDINSERKYISYTINIDGKAETILLEGKVTEEEMPEEKYAEILGLYLRRDNNREEQFVTNMQVVTKLNIQAFHNKKRILNENIYEGQYYLNSSFVGRDKRFYKNITYISPIRHAEGRLFLSQVLDNPDLYEEMLAVLKEYDADIVSINYDSDNNKLPGRGVYKILSKAHQKALPLNVYGDGMKKAVLLMSAVVQAKNGILLLDEFETAIHTSAMDKTFKWILDACKKLNVQLFMTSHSKEAIDKVLKCAPELIDDIAVYTMYKNDENVSVRRLDARKAIEVQDEMGLELR